MTSAWKTPLTLLVITFALFATEGEATAAEAAESVAAPPKLGISFTELRPTVEELRFVFACEDGLAVEARWIAQNVGKSAPPNHVIGTYKFVTRGPLNRVSLSRPTNGWPLGLYRLELVHQETTFHVEYYVIEQAQTK